jgi:16S rRNA (uracil1498-N3)-methyltransferase
MQYIYNINASEHHIQLKEDDYRYIIKVRRHKIDDIIALRNLKDDILYSYKIESITRRELTIGLISQRELIVKSDKNLHIGWCVIDTKIIEKNISSLNEMGVEKISFIYCNKSQRNFKIDTTRLNKILLNSSQQCGRSQMMKIEIIDSLDKFLEIYPQSYMLNFSDSFVIDKKDDINHIIIGCEGGFSSDEIDKFEKNKIVGFNSSLILKSETAVLGVTSICLL